MHSLQITSLVQLRASRFRSQRMAETLRDGIEEVSIVNRSKTFKIFGCRGGQTIINLIARSPQLSNTT